MCLGLMGLAALARYVTAAPGRRSRWSAKANGMWPSHKMSRPGRGKRRSEGALRLRVHRGAALFPSPCLSPSEFSSCIVGRLVQAWLRRGVPGPLRCIGAAVRRERGWPEACPSAQGATATSYRIAKSSDSNTAVGSSNTSSHGRRPTTTPAHQRPTPPRVELQEHRRSRSNCMPVS